MTCTICSGPTAFFASATVLGKYQVDYFQCGRCGFLRTEEPYWLEEAYLEAIKRSDVGHVQRNLRLAKIVGVVITAFFNRSKRFLDFGSGYGLLARIMRDSGFDFYCFDKHCANLFAPDFVVEPSGMVDYELVTAFEVFEHLVDPISGIKEMLSFSKSIFFTTELLPEDAPRPDEWVYYGLEHGQHVSFYTIRSLAALAERFSLNLYSDGRSRHLLTPKKLLPSFFRVVSLYKVAALLNPLLCRKSLTAADQKMIVGKDFK